MDIKQHKQFLLSEIKINDPIGDKHYILSGEYADNVEFEGTKGQCVNWITKNFLEDTLDYYSLYTQEEYDDAFGDGDNNYELDEDVSNFKVGQTKQSDGHKSTVTDVNPTTNSVTWTIKKDITDKEIWEDLSKVIQKFETIQVKNFHSRPKLIQLIKDLKTIRNKFSRTIQK